jgi:hypothetical protein
MASDPKHILQSKTFWTNLLAPVFLFISTKYAINLDPDTQTVVIFVIMSIVNIGLRAITTGPVNILPAPPAPPAPPVVAPGAG